jgi:hypothetical protein
MEKGDLRFNILGEALKTFGIFYGLVPTEHRKLVVSLHTVSF